MKKSRILQILCVGCSLVLTVQMLGGCAGQKGNRKAAIEPMEVNDVPALTFDFLGGEDVMPIGSYYGPMPSNYSFDGATQPDMFNDEFFADIAACGINLILQHNTDYETAPQYAEKMLKLGTAHGIGIFVHDSKICGPYGENTASVEQLSERINRYADYAAFCGMDVLDEPSWPGYAPGNDNSRDIEFWSPLLKRLRQLNVNAYINLLPLTEISKTDRYRQYVELAIKQFDSNYLSYDYYPWDETGNLQLYFANLSIARELSMKHIIPFWSYIQAGSQWNDEMVRFDSKTPYYPNEAQFRWNVNTSLAYGAKGIQYFMLVQPYYFALAKSQPFDFNRNGIFGAWGNKNQWYYYAQNINQQIAAVDEVLMHSESKGVIVTGDAAKKDSAYSDCLMKKNAWRELTGVEGDALIGCFNYRGKTALYVVNYDYEYAQDITLTFSDTYKLSVVQSAKKSYIQAKDITLQFLGGEGALLVFE